jgi:hypothetical protein
MKICMIQFLASAATISAVVTAASPASPATLPTATNPSVAAVSTNAPALPTASELLDKYKTTLDKFKSVILKAETTIFTTNQISGAQGQKVSGQPMTSYRRSEFRSDGNRHGYLNREWGNVGSATQVTPESQAASWGSFWDGQQKHDRGAGYVTYHTPGPTSAQATGLLFSDGEMRGYLPETDRRLDALARAARSVSVRKQTEAINGSDCYVIDAATDQGQLCLWIDPAHGYQAARVTLSVAAGNVRLGQVVPGGMSVRRSLAVTRFEQKGGVWVPMEIKLAEQMQLSAREFSHSYVTLKCTEIMLNPDHDALHSFDWTRDPELKDGTVIHEIGPSGVEKARFVWRGGEPVPDTTWHPRGRGASTTKSPLRKL